MDRGSKEQEITIGEQVLFKTSEENQNGLMAPQQSKRAPSPINSQPPSVRWLRQICNAIGHLHEGVILLPRPECFVKMLSYSNLSSLLGIKRQLEKLALQ